MSDPATPDLPAPTPEQPPAPAEAPKFKPPQPGQPRQGGSERFKRPGGGPPREKPKNPGGAPPALDRRPPVRPDSRSLDKEIEAELEAAMAGFNVEGTLAKQERKPESPAGGTPGKKRGTIVGVHGKDVFVEVPGGRSQGVLPIQQFERRPEIGDSVEFDIERYDAANGLLLLTREGAVQAVTDWSSVTVGMIVEAKVTETNKNKTGLLIEINGIKGFMPVSQIDLYRVENVDQFVNQRMKCMITEVNPAERNLLASRRALLEREKQEKAEVFWQKIEEGQTHKGIVRNIKPFGAFVDLGGQDGLIPVSEMSWTRVNDPNELMKIGDTVEVIVTRVDREARRIGLSLKRMGTSPFDEFATRVKAGARVIGKVSRIADFGAFVELEPGVEGLIHISELSTQRVRKVREVVDEGQMVDVEILNVDPASRRIALSLKTIASEKEAAEFVAAEAERASEMKEAEERMANRKANPNLRGGLGSNRPLLGES